MYHKFILYPEAADKLNTSGLKQRVEDAIKEYESSHLFTGHIFDDTIDYSFKEMKNKGYFSSIPKEISDDFKRKLTFLPHHPGNYPWIITKPKGKVNAKIENGELLLIFGYYASLVLKPEEFWQFERFGFDSYSELFGAIGIQMISSNESCIHKCHVWNSATSDNRRFKSEVTRSSHGDLRIFRTDLTHYPTIDPLGNKVSYRPVVSSDISVVSGSYSTECSLLASILKYVDQEDIQLEMLSDNAKAFINEVKTWQQIRGNFADFGTSGVGGVKAYFWDYVHSVPQEATIRTFHTITSEYGKSYGIYTDNDKNLLFFHMDKQGKTHDESALAIPSDETEHLIKGLFVQARKGFGRTSIKQLVDVIEYRFSEEFKNEQRELDNYKIPQIE